MYIVAQINGIGDSSDNIGAIRVLFTICDSNHWYWSHDKLQCTRVSNLSLESSMYWVTATRVIIHTLEFVARIPIYWNHGDSSDQWNIHASDARVSNLSRESPLPKFDGYISQRPTSNFNTSQFYTGRTHLGIDVLYYRYFWRLERQIGDNTAARCIRLWLLKRPIFFFCNNAMTILIFKIDLSKLGQFTPRVFCQRFGNEYLPYF